MSQQRSRSSVKPSISFYLDLYQWEKNKTRYPEAILDEYHMTMVDWSDDFDTAYFVSEYLAQRETNETTD